MPIAEEDFLIVRRSLSHWVTEIVLSNADRYFDINRISEGVALKLLNLIFDYNLIDLNSQKINYPGVDLGDSKNAKLAFQITSQSSSSKVIHSLKIFREQDLIQVFPNGIRFLIVNNKKKHNRYTKGYDEFRDIFTPEKDILYLEDLIALINNIYYENEEKFFEIKNFLDKEFGKNEKRSIRKSVISLESPIEQLTFYKKVFIGKFTKSVRELVHFSCNIDDVEKATDNLVNLLNDQYGLFLIGPSGCGKSILSKKIALDFLNHGISIILECKYYDTSLDSLFSQEITSLGFADNSAFFEAILKLNSSVLLVIDGFNECDANKKAKLAAELEIAIAKWPMKVVISSQTKEELLNPLKLLDIKISFPSTQTKSKIAKNYNPNKFDIKFESILNIVTTSLEARMLGEIASKNIEGVSNFTLFELFIKQKLGKDQINCIFFMARVAELLFDKLSFSVPEREIENILRLNNISENTYSNCISSKILDLNFGQISFAHEMFYNFFVAEGIARFSANSETLVKLLNLPKYYDKKLLIVGSLSDTKILNDVLSNIKDTNLLLSLISGEAGYYCQSWCFRKLFEILNEIEGEIESFRFQFIKDELWGLGFDPTSLKDWSIEQLAYINLIPCQLSDERIFKKFFELVAKMDDRIQIERKKIYEIALKEKMTIKGSFFSIVYIGFSNNTSALTKVISNLHSGVLSFYEKPNISFHLNKYIESKKILSNGQLFFLLALLRWSNKLQIFFEYICNLLEKKWDRLPSHLKLEILHQITYFPRNETEKDKLIDILRRLHQFTNDIWISSSLFDALKHLGALEADSIEHIPYITTQINEILDEPNLADNCTTAFGIYNSTYDHPYSHAYRIALSNLDEIKEAIFMEMAVKGMSDVFLGAYLIIEAEKLIGSKICLTLNKWTTVPIFNISMPQDSIKVFLISHIILAKHNYNLRSNFAKEEDLSNKSLLAAAEIYYWYNRSDLEIEARQMFAKSAADVLFDLQNPYTISTVFECRANLIERPCGNFLDNIFDYTIENWYNEKLINICKKTLDDLSQQKNVTRLEKDVKREAIAIIARVGSIIDIDLLKQLIEHQDYGKEAIEAIKLLSSNGK